MGAAQSRINAVTVAAGGTGVAATVCTMGASLVTGGAAAVVGMVAAAGARVVAMGFLRSRAVGGAGVAGAFAGAAVASVVAGPIGVVFAASVAGPVASFTARFTARYVDEDIIDAASSALCVGGGLIASIPLGIVGGLLAISVHPYMSEDARDYATKALVGCVLGNVGVVLFAGDFLSIITMLVVGGPFVNWFFEELDGGRDLIDDNLAFLSHFPIVMFAVAAPVFSVVVPIEGCAAAIGYAWGVGCSAAFLSTLFNGLVAFGRLQRQVRREALMVDQ